MKLYITTPSPFARKVRIVAHEKGLADRIEEVVVDPYANAPELLGTNPVVQVPTLVAEDGLPLNDSPVIAQYLDMIGTGPTLLPTQTEAWLKIKRLETLGNQALEMGVKLVLEKRRPESERSASWIDRWTANMGRALDALEAENLDASDINLGTITAAIAVTWIGFRHPDYDWKTGRPKLVAFQQTMEERDSFKQTYPR
ncbi:MULTISPECIES: glutathione S-transferase N-terminal domain-containing protein [unclassified Brevundimonas]|uniref:glutathione S-transferase N-terminal domain-containing protein n=1 Tax=unclassified Brevundimonas TaxID=2622653 RepID=UPI0025BD8DCD|nr:MULTISPECIES: glutathione S-transferase N-terminal domain-containing protein [unclassified Brevundimonas]